MTYKYDNSKTSLNYAIIKARLGHEDLSASFKYINSKLNDSTLQKVMEPKGAICLKNNSRLNHLTSTLTDVYLNKCSNNYVVVGKANKSLFLNLLKLYAHPFRSDYLPITASQFRHEYASLYFSFLKPSNTKRK